MYGNGEIYNFKEKMGYSKAIIFFIIFGVVLSCNSPKTEKGEAQSTAKSVSDLSGSFVISGAYALYPLVFRLAEEFMLIHPGVKIELKKASTGEGITDLITDQCDLAMISRPLNDEELNAGILVIPVAKDGVAPIINQKNPNIDILMSQGISPDELMHIFTSGKQSTWGEVLGTDSRDKITVYIRADESGASDIFAQFIYRKSSDLRGIGVNGDYEMIKRIQEDPLALGFCNLSYAFDTTSGERTKDIQIIPTDLDFDNKIDRVEVPFMSLKEAHQSLWLGFFPDQLCRELTIGTMGKPKDPAVLEFLYFVLGEGQLSVTKSGFCPLNNVYIKFALNSLK